MARFARTLQMTGNILTKLFLLKENIFKKEFQQFQ